MTTLNEYYNEIRSDIAKDFGLEAGGYAPRPRYVLPVDIAVRINAKYPSVDNGTRWGTLNPQAVIIAKRYVSLMMKGGK